MFTWDTGPGLCLTINWCKKASRGASLNTTEQRTQVADWHLFYERGSVFTEIPPLKYLHGSTDNGNVLKRDNTKPVLHCKLNVTVTAVTYA